MMMTDQSATYWEARAMCAAIELHEAQEGMRHYLLTVAANAMSEVRAARRVAAQRPEQALKSACRALALAEETLALRVRQRVAPWRIVALRELVALRAAEVAEMESAACSST